MSFELLQFFRTLFETRSLTYTSGQLGMSQAGASRMLLKLRAVFKDALFIRTRYGMVPTARAEALFPRVLTMLSDMERMVTPEILEAAETPRTLRIGTADNAVFAVFPRFFKKMFEKTPQAQIELHPLTPDIFSKLENGHLDAAICPRDPLPSDFHKQELLEDNYVCLVHEGHPLAHHAKDQTAPTLKELNNHRRIVITPYSSRQGVVVDGMEHRNQIVSPISAWVPYFLGAPLLLDKNGPFLLLPKKTAQFFCRVLPLVIFPCPVETRKLSIRLIWHHRMHNEPAMKWLRTLFSESAMEIRNESLQQATAATQTKRASSSASAAVKKTRKR